ncbi:MAG: hypothetical protein DI539_07430 [Flavobacterium psychrophilum]|nr:MAG: hypothetical protein DI539_07430 [Flavobacterium psychrophilum]
MDKFIKSIPIIVAFSLLILIWQVGDDEFSNLTAALVCASVVVMLAAVLYIIMNYFEQNLMPAKRYIVLILVAGLITFIILYAGLEYFYS